MDYNYDVVKIKNLGSIITGRTPKTEIAEFWDGDIKFITPKDIQTNKYVNKTERYITKKGAKSVATAIIPPNSIAVSCIGVIGYTGFVKEFAVTNQQINSIIPNKDYDAHYVYYLMKNSWNLFKMMENQSTTVSILNKTSFGNLEIKVVKNKNIQRKIANILASLDEKIELNNKMNKILEDIALSLYREWFINFEFPDEEGLSYKSNGGKMMNSELGEIPYGWQVKSISDITNYNKRGFSPVYTENDEPSGIPVINQRCIRNHTIIEEAVRYNDPYKKGVPVDKIHQSWDVLINSMGVGTLGRVAISSIMHPKIVHSVITILRPNQSIISKAIFSYAMLNLEDVFIQMGEGSTGQTSLSNTYLGQLKIVVPPVKIQEKLEPVLRSIQETIDQNYLENNKLIQIRDLLLPKLMNGEIKVPIEE